MPSSMVERTSQWSALGHTQWTHFGFASPLEVRRPKRMRSRLKTSSAHLRPAGKNLPPLLKDLDFDRLMLSQLGIAVDART